MNGSDVALPPLPSLRLIEATCEEVAAREHVDPIAVEKDFYLTRLIWAIAQAIGDKLLLKGGTLLSKVDLGYFRMSEDIDLVLRYDRDLSLTYGTVNVRHLLRVYETLKSLAPVVGIHFGHADGLREYAANRGRLWEATYDSRLTDRDNLIQVEVTLGHLLRDGRRATLNQLAAGALAQPGPPDAPYCYALDADEARAEKVRAAFDRLAIRDFYDLHRLLAAGADFSSPDFVALVDDKLREVHRSALAQQPAHFGKSKTDLVNLERQIDTNLAAVVRHNEPRLDLTAVLDQFDVLWAKRPS